MVNKSPPGDFFELSGTRARGSDKRFTVTVPLRPGRGRCRCQVVDAFLELDTSRRGTIRLHELRDVLQRFGIPDQEPGVAFLWWIYHEWDIPFKEYHIFIYIYIGFHRPCFLSVYMTSYYNGLYIYIYGLSTIVTIVTSWYNDVDIPWMGYTI